MKCPHRQKHKWHLDSLRQSQASVMIPKALITSSVSKNTLRNYRFWSKEIEAWLVGRPLDDGLLATYITGLHAQGKSPSTISQAVAAVRWQAKNQGIKIVGEVTTRTLAGIRRKGKDRERGQVDGLTWADVERVCAFAEMDGSVAGLRDSALIRLMSDCLLRVSEAVAVNVEDVKDKTLIVRSSKTDQEGVGETLYVTSDTRRIINRYRAKAGIEGGALFRRVVRGDHVQVGRLTARSADNLLGRVGGCRGLHIGSLPSCRFWPSRLLRRVHPLWICRLLVGGSRQRCRRTMRKRNGRNGASCWAPCGGYAHLRNVSDSRVAKGTGGGMMARAKGLENFNLSLIRYLMRAQSKDTTALAVEIDVTRVHLSGV